MNVDFCFLKSRNMLKREAPCTAIFRGTTTILMLHLSYFSAPSAGMALVSSEEHISAHLSILVQSSTTCSGVPCAGDGVETGSDQALRLVSCEYLHTQTSV